MTVTASDKSMGGKEDRRSGRGHGGKSAARMAGVQALYEIDMTGAAAGNVLVEFMRQRWAEPAAGETLEPLDRAHFSALVKGVLARRSRIDEMIGAALAEGRSVDGLEVVLRAILRAGAFELLALDGIPPAVVINEYMNIAHAFYAGAEPGLVNAILDRLGRIVRTREMETPKGEQTAE